MTRGVVGIKKFEEKLKNPSGPEWDTLSIHRDLARRLRGTIKVSQERLAVVEKIIKEKEYKLSKNKK